MPLRLVALYNVMLGLRELVFPTPLVAAISNDVKYPGLFSGFAARAAYLCWADGELPLWAAAAQGGGLEPVSWRPGRFIDWPDTNADVAITEAAGLLSLPEEPSFQRRENIATSTAGARRLRAFVRAGVKKTLSKGVPVSSAEIEQLLRGEGPLSEEEASKRMKEFAGRKPPRSLWRPVHKSLKLEDEAAFKPKVGRPREK